MRIYLFTHDGRGMLIRRMLLAAVGSAITTALAGCGATGGLTGLGPGSDDPRRSAVETYDAALVERNDATGARDTGINLFNAEEYGESIDRFNTALTGYEEARTGFSEAADLVADLDDAGEATTICERAVEATRVQIEATEAALDAATAAAEGAGASAINDHVERFQRLESRASSIGVEDTDALVSALGLE